MHRASHLPLVGVGLSVALLLCFAALALSAGVGAQERRQADRPRGEAAQAAEVTLTPSRGSGVRGTATLKGVARGVKVTLQMRNLPEPGVKHINHIHAGGTCADDRAGRTAPVTIPLKTITAQKDGTGSATTTIKDISVAQLFREDRERFILLHAKAEKGEGVPPGISCADLQPLAESGGISPATVLLTGALLALGGAAGLAALVVRWGRA
jgi:Cu/Zn superoxide dismutase